MHKSDFLCIIVAQNCNPNGDPVNGNRPRVDFSGHGEISPECIKRKIRNRLQDMGENIFIQSNERSDDGYNCLKNRYRAFLKRKHLSGKESEDILIKETSREWIDVRSFGCVFPFKGDFVSFGVRGPVSITFAKTIDTVNVRDVSITKSTNVEDVEGKDSATFGRKSIVENGAYVFSGSIFPQLAQKTGFSEEDAEKIKNAILTLFENDASAARPSGSMGIGNLFWWTHVNQTHPTMDILNTVTIKPLSEYPYYTVDVKEPPVGVHLDILR